MALKVGLCAALNKETLDQLRKGSIRTVQDFILKDPELLSQELHITYEDICSIRHALLAEYSAHPVSAVSLYQSALSSLAILSTGCDSLDQLLDGGLYTGEVTELAGDTAVGKSKICLWSASNTVKSENQSVVYIDTSSSFSAECVLEVIAEDSRDDEALIKSRLQKIECVKVFDVFELFSALDDINAKLIKQNVDQCSCLKLMIVDNIASVINPIMGNQAAYSQGLLCQFGLKLNQLAATYSIAILVTNNMVSHFNGSDRKPALGKAWSHMPQTRLIISRHGSKPTMCSYSLREARLIKSSRQQTPSSTVFSLDRQHSKPEPNV